MQEIRLKRFVKLKTGRIEMKKYIQTILSAIGYYNLKSKWRWYQYITRLQQEDAARKAEALAWIEAIDHRLLPEAKKKDNVTVSLTSHGKRVVDFAPFAIYSIFHQTVLPNRIVLNINREKWNDDNLPDLIKKLQIAGLEVNLCEDVGPHTKLLPALEKYPEDLIITVDDDVYYDKELVEELLHGYDESEKNAVVTRWAMVIAFEDGKMLPYSKWQEVTGKEHGNVLYSPLGVAGVLYPSHVFTDEVFNKEVYRNLCKGADDIWFSIQEYINKIPVYYVTNNHWRTNGDVDHYAEYVEHGSDALHFQNVNNGQNDVQIKNLIEYYHING